jgi:hypothetical protein
VILSWRQYEIGTNPVFLPSNAVHRAGLLKADAFPGWRWMHKPARFARKRCPAFPAENQNGKINQ